MRRQFIITAILSFVFVLQGVGQTLVSSMLLEQPISSRVAALGGNNTSFIGKDISFSVVNPAILPLQQKRELLIHAASYFAGTGYGSGMYSFGGNESGMWLAGFQYVDYGLFKGFDEYGNATSEFTAKDLALYGGYGYRFNPYFSIGGILKPVLGIYETYSTYAIAADFGALYINEEQRLQIGLTARNIGGQFYGYDSSEPNSFLPINLAIGLSKRLQHAPFVFHLTMQQLQRWNYDTATNLSVSPTISTVSKIARHFIIGVDIVPPSDKFWLALSYNFQRGQELPVPELVSLAGFSGGLGFKIQGVELGIGVGSYHQAATTLHITLRTDLLTLGF